MVVSVLRNNWTERRTQSIEWIDNKINLHVLHVFSYEKKSFITQRIPRIYARSILSSDRIFWKVIHNNKLPSNIQYKAPQIKT